MFRSFRNFVCCANRRSVTVIMSPICEGSIIDEVTLLDDRRKSGLLCIPFLETSTKNLLPSRLGHRDGESKIDVENRYGDDILDDGAEA